MNNGIQLVGSVAWVKKQLTDMTGFHYGEGILNFLCRQAKRQGVECNIHDAIKWHDAFIDSYQSDH
jgi:hypothetical protein